MTEIQVISQPKTLQTFLETKWSMVVIDSEIFIATYNKAPYFIQVFDADNGLFKREFTIIGVTPSTYGSMGTDGINLYVCNNNNQLVNINKMDGSIINIRTTPTYSFGMTPTFTIDLNKDIIIYAMYNATSNNFVIRRFSDGVLLKSYSLPQNTNSGGVTLYKESYFIIAHYGARKIYISSDISEGFDSLTFREILTNSGLVTGIGTYKNHLYFNDYTNRKLITVDITEIAEKRILLMDSSTSIFYHHDGDSWISLGTNPTVDKILELGMMSISAQQIKQFEDIYGLEWSPIQWTDGTSSISSTLSVTPPSQILTAKNSIQLTGVADGKFKWIATGEARVAISVDDGVSYHAFKNGTWINVTNDMSNAMTASEYTAMTWEEFKLLKGDSNFLKHQYYISANSTVDDILITAELTGTNRLANTTDYSLSYDQLNKQIKIRINKSGTYFATYVDV